MCNIQRVNPFTIPKLCVQAVVFAAVNLQLLLTVLFRYIPLRSAIDLTKYSTHDVEQALNEGKPASLLTLDVKGAFDTVLSGRQLYTVDYVYRDGLTILLAEWSPSPQGEGYKSSSMKKLAQRQISPAASYKATLSPLCSCCT